MKRDKTMYAAFILSVLAFLGTLLFVCRETIFQRGNPIPYLIAAVQISESNPYVAVDDGSGTYISMSGECPELLDFFQEKTGMDFVEQVGSGYLFADDAGTAVISSEVYWKYFTVWELPDAALAEKEN